MNKIIKVTLALFCACVFINSAYADNNTEFGIEDDLTVLGNTGDIADPDVEIAGFTVFGTTKTGTMYAAGAGAVAIGEELQVDSTAYFVSGSSFTAGAASIFISDGVGGQVLKKVAGGAMVWADDNTGLATLGTARRLQMVNNGGDGLIDSMFLQNAGDTNITMITGSSMTILGDGTDGLGVTGAAKITGALSVIGANATTLGGALNVAGMVVLGDQSTDIVGVAGTLDVDGDVTFGDQTTDTFDVAGYATFADTVSIKANGLKVLGDTTAGKVLKNDGSGFAYWADDDTGDAALIGAPKYLTRYQDGGSGIIASSLVQDLATSLTLMSSSMTVQGAFGASGNATLGGTLDVTDASTLAALTASGLVTANLGLSVTGADASISTNLSVDGNAQLGDALSDDHGVNIAPEAGIALKVSGDTDGIEVIGGDQTNEYAAKFYSGVDLAAWIRKK